MEDGYLREYDVNRIPVDAAGVNLGENAMLHVLDLGANYCGHLDSDRTDTTLHCR
jgi:hypothetical protein